MPSLVRRQCLRFALYLRANNGVERQVAPSTIARACSTRPKARAAVYFERYPERHPMTGQASHLILVSVLKRNQGAMGRFCLAFLASFRLVANDFCDGCNRDNRRYM